MWNVAKWLRSEWRDTVMTKIMLIFPKSNGELLNYIRIRSTRNANRVPSSRQTAYSVHQSNSSPTSKPTKYRQPTQNHRMIVRISVTSVNSAGRQAAKRQLLNRRLGRSLCSFLPWPGFSWNTVNFQRRILPTKSWHLSAIILLLDTLVSLFFLKWRNNFYPLSVDNQC
jgi:hypothetical protein